MDDFVVPLYYVVSRKLPPEEAFIVLHCLSITPCQCAVISDVHDCKLAITLSNEIIRAATDEDAHLIAKDLSIKTKRPLMVIGEANFLDAVYPDGHREPIARSMWETN